MVLLCYDHHENVRQIQIDSDSDIGSDSEDDSDDDVFEDVEDDHKDIVQQGRSLTGSVRRWGHQLSIDHLFEFVSNPWFICALLIFGIALIFTWFCL